MTIYSYRKSRHSRFKKIALALSLISIFTGLAILALVLVPIISFELTYQAEDDVKMVNPLPNREIVKNTIINGVPQVLGAGNTDYTKASVWFPKAEAAEVFTKSNIDSYTLSIPKLHIDKAEVVVNADDLSKSLVHFSGPLPGNFGNPIIFGHSTIIWLYNPLDYKTIFSKLPELKKNDEIFATVDNITYKYQVFEMKVVYPDDVSVLSQKYGDAYITLVTCVPPGTYFKRLIVRGRLTGI
jgi:sortase A